MNSTRIAALFFVLLVPVAFAQESSIGQNSLWPHKSDMEMKAITNLRKFAMGESRYAMSHPNEGFACSPQVLTQVQWPNSSAVLVEPALLNGTGNYKFSASCPQDSKPGSKLNIFAVPIDPHANLRTFCAVGRFGPYETAPYFATSEFPIRSISAGNAASCLASGEPLK